jgi:hypothetical protein
MKFFIPILKVALQPLAALEKSVALIIVAGIHL